MFSLFRRREVPEILDDTIQETAIRLFEVALAAEYWKAQENLLRSRLARLTKLQEKLDD
jgi:hypothetical protein